MKFAITILMVSLINWFVAIALFAALLLDSDTYVMVMAQVKNVPIDWEIKEFRVDPKDQKKLDSSIRIQKTWDQLNEE